SDIASIVIAGGCNRPAIGFYTSGWVVDGCGGYHGHRTTLGIMDRQRGPIIGTWTELGLQFGQRWRVAQRCDLPSIQRCRVFRRRSYVASAVVAGSRNSPIAVNASHCAFICVIE